MANFSLESIYNWYRKLIANPKYRWWVIAATLVYVVSPIDISPDVIPFIGQIDDAVVVTLLATELASLLRNRVSNKKQSSTTDNEPTADMVDVVAVEVQ